jgi:hypothetical protein
MASEETITRTLESQGWCRQFVASEPRLSEAVEMYRELGFQVHLEPLPTPEATPVEQAHNTETKCRACFHGVEIQHRIIFTRPAENNGQPCSG